MLNKPTNVSPYNEFIDINNGLELKFTLNNVVDNLNINIYKDNNTKLISDYILNETKRKEFLYEAQIENLINNGNDANYFWRAKYWKSPLEENKIYSSIICANYYDRDNDVIGLLPNSPPQLEDSDGDICTLEVGATSVNAYFDGDNVLFPFASAGNAYYDNMFLKFASYVQKNSVYLCSPKICVYMGVFNLSKGSGVWYAECKTKEVIPKENRSEFINSLNSNPCYFVDLTNVKPPSAGNYISLSYNGDNTLYKINSSSVGLFSDEIPSVKVFGSLSGFDATKQAIYCENVSVYDKVEYNESPPYYFSCRETPDIDLYDVSTSSPQIKLCANIRKYIDLNSYSYEVYRFDNNIWQLLWKSEKLSTVNSLENGSFDTETVIYNGITPQNTYKIKLLGQTVDGMDFEIEKGFLSENFSPTTTKKFISFNKDIGCIEIDNSVFRASNTTSELQIYRYDVLKKELNFVSASSYAFDVTTELDGFCKRTITYDFNVVSNVEYIYYAYIMNNDNIVVSYISDSIIPYWNGVYLSDVVYRDPVTYAPDLSKIWFIGLNYESGEVVRNYQISHPHGIGQKYPKSVRGNGNFKTGQLTGLLGNVSCISGEYEEDMYLIEHFDSFCANGRLKLLRSSVKGECLIADIDKMSSSEYAHTASLININYTQIDDVIRKQISLEV